MINYTADDLFHLLSLVALIVFDATNETHNAAKLNLDAVAADHRPKPIYY